MANKENALAVVEKFKIAKRYDGLSPELIEELQEQLADLDEDGISCNVVKIPSGGGTAFEIQIGGDPNNTEVKKELQGVVVFTHRMNAYWNTVYGSGDDGGQLPACSSMDGKSGYDPGTGEVRNCDTCPLNQYGTDIKGGKGKACKNMRRIYMICDGDPVPYLLTVPPTSIKDVNKQLTRILAAGIPYTGMIMRFKLEKVKNSNNVAYSRVVIEQVGALPQAATAETVLLRREIKDKYSSMAITLEDYVSADSTARQTPPPKTQTVEGGELHEIPDAEFEEAGELPFK